MCLTGVELVSGGTTLEAEILNINCLNYTLSYDEELLTSPEILIIPENITGVFCLNACLVTWLREFAVIVAPATMEDQNTLIETVDGLFAQPLFITDTDSINLTTTFDTTSREQHLSADVNISEDGGNSLEIRDDGLYASGGGGGSGVIEVTTAQLNTLISGDDLTVGATYMITDHVQGRVTAGTKVVVQAMSENQITSECQVLTEYDTRYWRGVYDITTNKLLELEDNQGNICRQFPDPTFGPYTPIDDFDWGNEFIWNCLVDNATWTTTYGLSPASFIDGVVLKNSGTLITTDWSGSYIYDLTITGFSQVDLTGGNAEFEECEFYESGYVTDYGLEISFYFLLTCQSSFIDCTEVGASNYIEGVTITGYSGIYNSAVSGELTVHKAAIDGEAEIRVVPGTVMTDVGFYSSSMTGCVGSGGSPQGGFYVSGTNQGSIEIDDSEISSGGCVYVNDVSIPGPFTDPFFMDRCHVSSDGMITVDGNSDDTIIRACEISSAGKIDISTNTGPVTVERCSLRSSGQMQISSADFDIGVSESEVSTGGVLNLTAPLDSTIISNVNVSQGTLANAGFNLDQVYILGTGISTCTGDNSATAKDYFNDTIV